MPSLRRLFVLACLAFATACSSEATKTSADDAGATDTLSSEESTAVGSGADAVGVTQEATSVADSIFDFDPTIDPAATPETNATNIQKNAQSNLNGCGSATVTGTTVTIAYGAPPGCTLANGSVVSGTITASVSKTGATTTVTLGFADVVVNGKSLAGTASFATTDGSTFAVTANLNGYAISLTVKGASKTYTVSGSASGGGTSVTFTNVVYVLDDCYPSGGSATLTKGAVTETIAFSAATATTGQVTVTIGKRTSTSTLPAYGSCPGAGWGAGRDAGRR